MEPLSDPTSDRQVPDVPAPPHRPLLREMLFPPQLEGRPDWEVLRDHLAKEGIISKELCVELIELATNLLRSEENLLTLDDPVTVVGDIHGQYYDFLRLLELGGELGSTKYLFLGDYVDRGSFSVECVLLLFAIKLAHPTMVFLLRGNHECRQMTSFFNFRDECLYKYDQDIYDLFMDSFDCLPLSCIVNKKFIAVHGGISPELVTIADIRKLNRFQEPPRQGLYCDVLWADPVEADNGASTEKFKYNEVRGCSYYFGTSALNPFLKRNRLLSVLRAHEAQLDGYKMHRWNGATEFPVVITIFSAPNYCDVYNNKGAIVKFTNNNLNIQQFNYTEHPYLLPNFMDIFTWSMPFVIEKVLEILYHIVKKKPNETLAQEEAKSTEVIQKLHQEVRESKIEIFRNKVKAVSRMMRMYKTLREEQESIVQLKGLCPDNKIPKGLLQEGHGAIRTAVESFSKAKEVDMVNERRPDSQ